MDKFIRFRDYIEIKPVKLTDGRLAQKFADNHLGAGQSLEVLADLTFAGLKTKNRALYLPDEVARGVKSWLKPYGKPIQLHHEDHLDPIGRIIDARYINTMDQVMHANDSVRDYVKLNDFWKVKDKAAVFGEMLRLSKDETYQGLGRIRGHLRITDRDAIEKLADGRYLTGSAGFRAAHAWCSTCMINDEPTDWADDGPCDHSPGEDYKGLECVLIPGGIAYDEYSFVNHPALVHSQVVELGTAGFADKRVDIKMDDKEIPKGFYELFVRNKDENGDVSVINIEDEEDNNILDFQTRFTDMLMLLDKKTESAEDIDPTIKDPEQRETNMLSLMNITKDTATNYATLVEHLPEDAKLTDEKLAELDDSAFIGVGRTFPVPDAAHAEAVRKVLDQVEEGEGLKTLLLSELDKAEKKFDDSQGNTDTSDDAGVIGEGDGETDPVTKLQDEIEDLKVKLSEKDQMVELLRRNLTSVEDELNRANEAALEFNKRAHDLVAEKIVDKKVALGETVEDRDTVIKDFASRTWESLSDTLKDLEGRTSTPGLARDTVEDAIVDDPTNETEADLTKFAAIVEQYKDHKLYKGAAWAEMWLQNVKHQGLFPADAKIQ